MNILINAYACRPDSGSEGGMTWRWIEGLARLGVEVYVITEGEWREDIEKALAASPYQHLIHFYYNPLSDRIRKMCWNQGDYRFYYYYRKWQKKTLKIAESIVKNYKIDIIHQLSMIGFREPGYLWKIKGIPYVWGPIGGMTQVPLNYLEDTSLKIKTKYWLKNYISKLQFCSSPRVLLAFKHADVLIAANQNSYKQIKSKYLSKNVVLINETGCSLQIADLHETKEKKEFNILWVGRFIPTKMLKLSLEVMCRIKSLEGVKLHIVGQGGNGEETKIFHSIATALGIAQKCEWHGWVSHEEVQRLMQNSDVLFFPSIVEGTPHVVLEAIANHLPVVCFDICGQGDVVNDEVGIKIPLSNLSDSMIKFSEILKGLYERKDHLERLSIGCVKRKEELSWDNKILQVYQIYQGLCYGS